MCEGGRGGDTATSNMFSSGRCFCGSVGVVDGKTLKTVDDIQDFVSDIDNQSLKQRLIESYFKKQC